MVEIPKIFISYSWATPAHEDWVINLAERLVSDGVDVIIDKWELKEGQDKYNFMEQMVKSPDIVKVLMILERKYKEKAESRKGGVGTETQIISPQIYENVSQEKFIPIVAEKDENEQPFVPTFLKGRIYIDLSEQANYEQNYENLLRNIFKRPAYSKPKLGKAPDYLFEDTPNTFKTSYLIKSFDNQINKNPKLVNSLLRNFLSEFNSYLKDYRLDISHINQPYNFGKDICDNINSYTPLRNDFIVFFDKLINLEIEFDIDYLIKFMENIHLFTSPQENNEGSWYDIEFDNYKFIIHELFLYLIAIGLKNENYKFVEELLYSSYFIPDRFNPTNEPKRYSEFYANIKSIDSYYLQTYSKNIISPMADLIITRIPDSVSKINLLDADLLCYYMAQLNDTYWFPLTYIYRSRQRFELFERIVSNRYFEKVKGIFNVKNVEEFKDKIIEIQKKLEANPQRIGFATSFDSIKPIFELLKVDKIATLH